jgi:hypothetical protein
MRVSGEQQKTGKTVAKEGENLNFQAQKNSWLTS